MAAPSSRSRAPASKGYVVEDGVETWRLADFQDVKRTKITRRIGAG